MVSVSPLPTARALAVSDSAPLRQQCLVDHPLIQLLLQVLLTSLRQRVSPSPVFLLKGEGNQVSLSISTDTTLGEKTSVRVRWGSKVS